MKKGILSLMAFGVGMSALTGCAGAPAPTVTETVTAAPAESKEATDTKSTKKATPEATESSTTDDSSALEDPTTAIPSKDKVSDAQFTEFVRAKTTTAYIMSNYEIVELAKNACSTYEQGGNFNGILSDASDRFTETTNNVDIDKQAYASDIFFIVGAGVANYCPEYSEQIKGEAEEAAAAAEAAQG